MVRLAAQEQDRLAAIAHGAGMERMPAALLEAQREHRHDHLLYGTLFPQPRERHDRLFRVVRHRLLALHAVDDVRARQGDLGRDLHIGESVVHEVHVIEHALARRATDDVDPDARRPATISSDSCGVSFKKRPSVT